MCKTGFRLNNLVYFFSFYHTIRNPKSCFSCIALYLSSSRYTYIGDIFQVYLLNMLICQVLCVQLEYTYVYNIIIVYLQPATAHSSLDDIFNVLWTMIQEKSFCDVAFCCGVRRRTYTKIHPVLKSHGYTAVFSS